MHLLLAAYKQHEVQLDGKCGSLEIPESKKKKKYILSSLKSLSIRKIEFCHLISLSC